jgi:hypothetical protein
MNRVKSRGVSNTLRKYADGHGLWSVLLNLKRVLKGYQPIFLDHPIEATPRFGYGKPPHPELSAILAQNRSAYRELLTGFLRYSSELKTIPLRSGTSPLEPFWLNEWYSGIDLVAFYSLIASNNPRQLIEVGSGQSTKIARRAIKAHELQTKITSIDPQPRAEIDQLCDVIVRKKLEDCDLDIFKQLDAGDLFFFDGSHRTFMNSDVTVFFLEILPRLKPGVLVHIHDIFLPDDYVPWWRQRFYPHRYWSEQYVLAASLLAGHKNYEVVLPNHYVNSEPELATLLDPLWSAPELAGVSRNGSSFWIRTV